MFVFSAPFLKFCITKLVEFHLFPLTRRISVRASLRLEELNQVGIAIEMRSDSSGHVVIHVAVAEGQRETGVVEHSLVVKNDVDAIIKIAIKVGCMHIRRRRRFH